MKLRREPEEDTLRRFGAFGASEFGSDDLRKSDEFVGGGRETPGIKAFLITPPKMNECPPQKGLFF